MEAAKKNINQIDGRTEVTIQEKTFLVHGSQVIPINAESVSRYSLSFRYVDGHKIINSDESVNLLIKNNGRSVEVGPCRILSDPEIQGNAGRLVFLNDVYDFQCLLRTKKLIALQAPFKDLPAVMARKNNILQSFKEFTADLVYDLSAYKKIFDEQDSQYELEPDDVKNSVQQAIITTEGSKFMEFFHRKVKELEHQVASFDLEQYQSHGSYFRKQLWEFILCCALMARTNVKPRGYAGDSEMMKMIYQNSYLGESTFCKLMQKYTVGVPAAQSVRNRRKLIVDRLTKYRKSIQRDPGKKIRILSVACGPACELSDILLSTSDFHDYMFTLLDQDQIALNEAKQFATGIEDKFGLKIDTNYVKMSVRLMFARNHIERHMGKFDFIYSMGLFDYLSTPVAKVVIEKLTQLLLPNGEMVIGNFHVSNPSKCFMEYWGDWHLVHRTEEEFKSLLDGINGVAGTIIFEDTRSQMFLHVKKQAENY